MLVLVNMHTTDARVITSIMEPSSSLTPSNEFHTNQPANRHKRTIVFRPLFVYRQQQIKKTRVKDAEQQHHYVDPTDDRFGEPSNGQHYHHHSYPQPYPQSYPESYSQ